MNIVLIEPEIHWNTGNIGRTCVATGTTLHLVGKLGFSLEDKEIRRAGLDYWAKLKLRRHGSVEDFFASLGSGAPLYFFSADGKKSYWEAVYPEGSYLIFGREADGLPEDLIRRHAARMYRIPINDQVRSLNLSTSAGIVLYEALRQREASEKLSPAAR